MNRESLNLARTALVLIDLQNSNVGRELAPYTAEQAVGSCALLAQEMRRRGAMIVYVRVLVAELPTPLADAPMRPPGAAAPPYDASELAPQVDVEATDIVVTKRQWGAFYGTELDQLLRRRGIDTLVLGGIATNFGVESTARAAFDLNYALVFVEDAMTSMDADAHHFACKNIFPRMGRVRSTRAFIDMLQAGTGDA